RRRGALAPGQPGGQPDDDLDRALADRERGQAVQIAVTPADRGQRAGQQAVGIAPCYTDPGRSDVDGEPGPGPHQPAPCLVGLISTEGFTGATKWLQHGLTLR